MFWRVCFEMISNVFNEIEVPSKGREEILKKRMMRDG
jgi:hypothetical protein